MSFRVTLSSLIYSRESLESARAAYSAFCSVAFLGSTPSGHQIEIEAVPNVGNEVQVAREFMNYALDLSLEQHLREL